MPEYDEEANEDANEQNTTNNLTTTVCEDDLSFAERHHSTTQMNTNMSDTIVQAKARPFCFKIKKRLLMRDKLLDYLKSKPTYTTLMISAYLTTTVNTTLYLSDDTSYNLVKEVGRGSYGVIYLIKSLQTTENCALKVQNKYK